MNDFYNPYHFVPLGKKEEKAHQHWVDAAPCKNRDNAWIAAGHSRFAKGRHHGCIHCTLTTETPIFIGATRYQKATADQPARIAPCELDGNPAIPATSLRGMVSAIAEAASGSAMRVLENRALSWRKEAKPSEILSALGMIIKKQNNKGEIRYFLRPLALPTLRKKGNRYSVDDCYRKMFVEKNRPRLKVYIGSPPGAKSYVRARPVFYYMNLAQDLSFDEQGLLLRHTSLRHPANYSFVIGQMPLAGNTDPVRETEATEYQKKHWVRGILRIMRKDGREFPETRKHELFIPYPEEAENWKDFPIKPEAIERFHQIAAERTASAEDTPYQPVGTQRNDEPGKYNKDLRIKNGDLVYFRPDASGSEVEEISFSAIWRAGPTKEGGKPARLHDFIPDKELLPFNPLRKYLSPAERVFGFVEERSEEEKSSNMAAAYAGHVRFTAARWDGNLRNGHDSPYQHEVTLKILDSPKPPSPALYFRNRGETNSYIEKKALALEKHEPQGRKFYLHKYQKTRAPWATHPENVHGNLKQKSRITPLHGGLSFSFSIRFDNLDDFELGMLLYALSPNDRFQHKIGMGKPLGLGSVKITVDRVITGDRVTRYRERGPFSSDPGEAPLDWHACRDQFKQQMKDIAPAAIEALELMGDPEKVKLPVHYPQLRNIHGKKMELEHYRWWVKNDRAQHSREYLRPLDEYNGLPPLKRL